MRYSDPSSQQTQPPVLVPLSPLSFTSSFLFFFFLSLPLVYTQWRIKPKSTWTPSSTDCWRSVVAALENKFNCWRPKSATCVPRREKFSFRSLSSLNWRHPLRYESLLLCDTSGVFFRRPRGLGDLLIRFLPTDLWRYSRPILRSPQTV